MDFLTTLNDHVRRAGLTHAALAKAIEVRRPFVSQVLAGTRPLPVKQVEKWAVALNLSSMEREQFEQLAYLSRAPDPIKRLIASLEAELNRYRQKT